MNDFPFGAALRPEWDLDPGLAYLNHGSFGVTPRAVLAAQDEWRRRIDRNPAGFMSTARAPMLRAAATTVAKYLGAEGDDLVFMENATSAANAVLRSLAFKPGDEILVTSLGYRAVNHAAAYVASRAGATLVEAKIPLPVADADAIVAAVEAKLSPRTRLAIFDHISSQSAILQPVARLIAAARAAGAEVLIDGAHVPGQLPLDIPALGADYYVANLHKWLFAPRGTAILWARPDLQGELHPLTISHGYGSGFLAEFDWTGTRDLSGWLSAPDGIALSPAARRRAPHGAQPRSRPRDGGDAGQALGHRARGAAGHVRGDGGGAPAGEPARARRDRRLAPRHAPHRGAGAPDRRRALDPHRGASLQRARGLRAIGESDRVLGVEFFRRHGRTCSGHPRLRNAQGVDGRDKHGHDGHGYILGDDAGVKRPPLNCGRFRG